MMINRKVKIKDRRQHSVHINFENSENIRIYRKFLEVLSLNGVKLSDYLINNFNTYIEINKTNRSETCDFMTYAEIKEACRVFFEGKQEILRLIEKHQNWSYWRKSKLLRKDADYFPMKMGKKNQYFYNKERIFKFLTKRYLDKVDVVPDPTKEEIENELGFAKWKKVMGIENIVASKNVEDYK